MDPAQKDGLKHREENQEIHHQGRTIGVKLLLDVFWLYSKGYEGILIELEEVS